MLSPHVSTTSELSGQWYVAHTRSRFEKAFARDLLNCGVGYFLPLVERTRIISGKKRRVLLPLFPSYVFFCGDESAVRNAQMTNRLCQTITVPDQDTLIDELGAIERVLNGESVLDLYPTLAVGRRCRIISGPLLGLEGVITRRDSVIQLVLQVSILGQGVLLEISADQVELLD